MKKIEDANKMVQEETGRESGARTMTAGELFRAVCGILEEKGLMPDILEYRTLTHNPAPIKTCGLDLRGNLLYGGSKGISLSIWMENYEDNEKQSSSLGGFQTKQQSSEAVRKMAGLLADFVAEGYAYVRALDGTGKSPDEGMPCGNMEPALEKREC